MMRVAVIGLAVACATGAGEQSMPKQQISRAFGHGNAAQFNAPPQDQWNKKLCSGDLTVRCKRLFESMSKSLAPLLTKGARRAAREVKPFYKDGRPIKG